jgi:hypothetical protein
MYEFELTPTGWCIHWGPPPCRPEALANEESLEAVVLKFQRRAGIPLRSRTAGGQEVLELVGPENWGA